MHHYLKSILIFIISLAFINHLICQSFEVKIYQARTEYLKENLITSSRQIDEILASSTLEDFPKEHAEALTLKGSILRKQRVFEEAQNFHQKALEIRRNYFGENSVEAARSYSNLGNVFFDKEVLSSAHDYYSKSWNIYASLKLEKEAFSPLLGLTRIYTENGALEKAYTFINRLKKVVSTFDDVGKEVIYESARASFLYKKGEEEEAEKTVEKLLQTKAAYFNKAPELLPNLLHKLANFKIAKGNLYAAEQLLFKALSRIQNSQKVNAHSQGLIYQSLGAVDYKKGHWKNALNRFDNSRSFLKESDFEMVEVLYFLGKLNRIKGRTQPAEEYLDKSMTLLYSQKEHQRFAVTKQLIFSEFGTLYQSNKNVKVAESYFEKALQIEGEGIDFETIAFNLRLKMTGLFLQKKQTRLAEEELQKATVFLPKINIHQKFALTTMEGKLETANNQFEKAEIKLKFALNSVSNENDDFLFEKIVAHLLLAENQSKKARKTNELDDWQSVNQYAVSGIDLVEELSGNFSNPDADVDSRARFSKLYDLAIESCFNLQKRNPLFVENGWQIAQRFKTKQQKYFAYENASNDISKYESTLIEQIHDQEAMLAIAKKNKFMRSTAEPNYSSSELENLNRSIAQHETIIDKLNLRLKENQWKSDDPIDILDLKSFQKEISREQTLLHYHSAVDFTYLFVINTDSIFFERLTSSTSQIEKLVKTNFKLSRKDPITVADSNRKKEAEQFVQSSSDLYNFLIRPFSKKIKEHLLIVPDGLMGYLQFGALIKKANSDIESFADHQYLIEDHSVQYIHSYSDFLDSKRRIGQGNSPNFLAVAPAFLDNNSMLLPLQGTVEEAQILHDKLGGKLWLNQEANKEYFCTKAADFNVILLATHSFAMDDDPAHSHIAFSEKGDSTDSELLFSSEIYHQKIPADLVVLSSCQSGAGQVLRGEGLMSLAHAFFQAGTKSVVASLWNIADKQAPMVITIFFENLKNGATKPEALRQSKINYYQNAVGINAHPFFWSGFISINDDAPVAFAQGGWFVWIYGLLLFIIILVSILLFKRK